VEIRNSGETWTKVSSFPVTGDYVQDPSLPYTADPIGVVWISFDKASSQSGKPTSTVFVGVAQKSGPTVYQSDDAGATWRAIAGQPLGPDTAHIMPHHGVVRDSVLYLPYCNKGGPYDGNYGEIWKYNFHTSTWTDITPHSHLQDEAWGSATLQKDNPYYGYGGFDVDYKNPNIIIAATLNSWWPDAVLFKSIDGGATWTKSFYWTSYPSAKFKYELETTFPWLNWGITSQRWPDVVQPKLGWMISGIAINPFNSNEFMYGTGATIYGTKNFGDWGDSTKKVQIKSVADGIEECAVLSLAVPPITSGTGSNVKLLSGVGDLGGFAHTDLQTPVQMFLTPAFGNTHSIDYAELDPKQVVRVGVGAPVQYETPCHIANSTDGGLTWNKVYVSLDTTYKAGTVAMSAKGSNILWAPEGKVPYCGQFYGLKATNLPAGVWVASDRVDDSVFYAFKDSVFYKGNGSLFSKASTRLPFPASRIKAVPGQKGHVWLPAGKSGLWFTDDGGTTFKKIDTTKVQAADIVGFGKAAPSATYPAMYITGKVAGKTGIFMSNDQGGSWQRINDDAHQYGSINYAITGDMRQYGIVFVGTNGRGVVYGTASGSNNIATINKSTVSYKIIHHGSVIETAGTATLSLYDMRGTLLRNSCPRGGAAKIGLSGLAKGVYVARSGRETVRVLIR
jgi:xyloglucan-specific exo-beta-1,4-glucanase